MKPKEIKEYTLLEVCDLIPGGRATKIEGGTVLIYGAGNKPIGMTDKANCPEESIRLTRKGTVGYTYLHRESFWADDACYRVEPKSMIEKMYLFHWLKMMEPELARYANVS